MKNLLLIKLGLISNSGLASVWFLVTDGNLFMLTQTY